MLSVLMQVFVVFSLIVVLWCVYGYSLAFTEGNQFIGGFDRLFLNGTFDSMKGEFAMAATFSKATPIPELLFVAFQATFAAITCALILGAFAERVKFSAVLLFMVLWFTFAYAPIAHMVWFWMGPDAYTDPKLVDALNAKAGMIWQWGALDFAGGTVVHINAGIAGLVGAYLVGKRVGFGKEKMTPHNLPMTMIGASLLWFGWFGFNAGSALEANNFAVLAFMNTFLATACAVLSWIFFEWMFKGKPSMLGAASGAVAGLVAITPAAGNVGIPGAFAIGLIAGAVCLWGVSGLKKLLGADDSLDVFGVHAVGGILGALLTGVFNSPDLGGPGFTADWVTGTMIKAADYSIVSQVITQAKAVGVTLLWSGVVAFISDCACRKRKSAKAWTSPPTGRPPTTEFPREADLNGHFGARFFCRGNCGRSPTVATSRLAPHGRISAPFTSTPIRPPCLPNASASPRAKAASRCGRPSTSPRASRSATPGSPSRSSA
jgi:Amt family ammonium transporter